MAERNRRRLSSAENNVYYDDRKSTSDIDVGIRIPRGRRTVDPKNLALLEERQAQQLRTVINRWCDEHPIYSLMFDLLVRFRVPADTIHPMLYGALNDALIALYDEVGMVFGLGPHTKLPPTNPVRSGRRELGPARPRVSKPTDRTVRDRLTVCGTIVGWVGHAERGDAPCEPCTVARAKIPGRATRRYARRDAEGVDIAYVRGAMRGDTVMARGLTDDERLVGVVMLHLDRRESMTAVSKLLAMNHHGVERIFAVVDEEMRRREAA